MVTTVWELPPPDLGREVWPVRKLMGYEQMLADRHGRSRLSKKQSFRTEKTVSQGHSEMPELCLTAGRVPEGR